MVGSADKPRWMAIGNGSAAETVVLGSLIAESGLARNDFSTRAIDVPNTVTWTYDFSSTQLSGLALSEFGIGGGSSVGVNDLWNRESIVPINFDGTNEVQLEITFTIF